LPEELELPSNAILASDMKKAAASSTNAIAIMKAL
jgi:hypothetical protein